MVQDLQVVLPGFAETDTGVQDQELSSETLGGGEIQPFPKEVPDFPQQVVVVRLALHIPGSALHVHQDHRRLKLGGQGGHIRVETQGADVIDQSGAGAEGGPGHRRLVGIDGDGDGDFGGQGRR